MPHWSSGLPVCFLLWGTRVQSLGGVLMWNGDSPVSVVSLHWWPRCDWSFLWPRLRRALSRTVTRPSCRQCDNPTWSHTALLSRFHARCRSSFQLHNQHSRLLGGSPVESLQSHCIRTMSHRSSGLPVCYMISLRALYELYWCGDGLMCVQSAVYAGYTGLYTRQSTDSQLRH